MGLEKLLEQHNRNIIGGLKILTSQLTQAFYANYKEGYILIHRMFLSNTGVRQLNKKELMFYSGQLCANLFPRMGQSHFCLSTKAILMLFSYQEQKNWWGHLFE